MLTKKEILFILDALRRTILVTVEGNNITATIQRSPGGYSDNTEVSALQAKLSIMLEAASRGGR